MSIPASADRDPLVRYLKVQNLSDQQVRKLLRDASRAAQHIMQRTAGSTSSVRAAQLDIANVQQKLWRDLGGTIEDGVRQAGDAASDSVAHLIELHERSSGVTLLSDRALRDSLHQQGRAGIEAVLARGANGIPLAESVYRNQALTQGWLDARINGMLSNGASARELASYVKGFIDPNVRGGTSYAAMRLGRTELNNAFHTVSRNHWAASPFVDKMKWHISRSHPKPDECDNYADKTFPADDVPDKPHPQCFCYITPEVEDDDAFVRNYHAGKYDSWIDQQLQNA
jgi:hypothetical protein